MMRILAVGCSGIRGLPAVCAVAAAMVAGSGFGAPPAHAFQSPQQAGDIDATQTTDPADGAQAPAETGAAQATDTEQQAAEPGAEQPIDESAEEPPAGTFGAPAGLILSYIKSDSGADFERVMSRLGEALASSEDEQHRELASGWRIFRAREPGPDGEVLYVWLIDPVLAGADYAVPELLGAALPDESQALFDAFSEAFGSGQALINLEPVNIGPAPPE
ncbi:MAG: hypothetical protein J4F30_03410 [Acidobacteria bacterium]|nr:hypothetical protein [Acidobacteriota bacterium]